jgi:thiol:disulfide interchange protein DsbC
MNVLKTSLILCVLLIIISAALPVRAASPEESFRKNFPAHRADSIRPSGVNGLYEVVSGNRVLYYAPGPEYLIYGPMITREGKNLTEERVLEIMERGLKAIPLEKALRIGAGPHQVIEITDPDCTYCRRASAYLSGRNDVTRHVFFFPLAIHPNAAAKVRQIFCAEDRGKAYEEAMAGKLDDMKFTPCKSDVVEDLLKTHREIGDRVGVTGTPLFLIDGQVVFGADIPRMEKILGSQK